MNVKAIFLSLCICSIALPSLALGDISERVEFSGFGRVIAGYLDVNDAQYEGYSNSLSMSQQSLIALQSDITLTDSLQISGQLLAHSSDERKSGIEWLYLNYEPNQNWNFKVGKLRTPFFRFSDVVDVGFAYPWISPPQQVYSGFLFSNYKGASATYKFNFNQFNFETEGIYGSYDGKFTKSEIDTELTVNAIKGLNLSVSKGNLNARVSITESSDFFIDLPKIIQFAGILKQAGFKENAASFSFDGKVTVYQANINYDTLDYFLAAELVRMRSGLLVVPLMDSYYFSAGYNFAAFQVHVTYSVSENRMNVSENMIPLGITTELDQLSYSYDRIVDDLGGYNLNSLTIGARWDIKHNMAAKAEVSFLNGKQGENSFFTEISNQDFSRKATLYQLGIEWVY